MGLLDFFRSPRQTSAAVARERLQILVSHERSERNKPSYLPMLQEDILAVIRKYVAVDPDAVTVTMEKQHNREILELNVVLPERTVKRRRSYART